MASADLQWLLLRKTNSFQVKRLGQQGPIFTSEPGNLRNIHSQKYSGLIQPSIDVSAGPDGNLAVTTRKPSASPHAVKSARVKSGIRARSGPRRAAGAVSAYPRKGYRPDLSTLAVARASALLASKAPKKDAPPKKARGSKKAKATATAE
ncbi:hypothetical protein FRC03_001080 [Tulasnella sp. 419]|nr:hypothetical protein FRC02_003919 [Tulasnella sp. 418]KAG8969735.1 hypothetical protein FRC03_001080 [Tulasnella sp. 419]